MYFTVVTPDAISSLQHTKHGKWVMYAVHPSHDTPLFAQSHIAFCSACTMACSWLSRTTLIWILPGKYPLYPWLTILLSFTNTHPTCNLLQGLRVAVTFAISVKYSSHEGRGHVSLSLSLKLGILKDALWLHFFMNLFLYYFTYKAMSTSNEQTSINTNIVFYSYIKKISLRII